MRSSDGFIGLCLILCLTTVVLLEPNAKGEQSKMPPLSSINDYAAVSEAARGLPGTIVNNSLETRVYGAVSLGGAIRLYPLLPGHSSPAYAEALFLLPSEYKPRTGNNGTVFIQQLSQQDVNGLTVVAVQKGSSLIIARDGNVSGGTAKPASEFVRDGQPLNPETARERAQRQHELAVSSGGGAAVPPPLPATLRPCGCLNPGSIPSTVGLNLDALSDKTAECPFNDVFKCARLNEVRADNEKSYSMCTGLAGNYPAGTYTVKWQGTGGIAVSVDGKSTTMQSSGSGVHTMQVAVSPTEQGIKLVVAGGNPKDPIRDIHVYLPDTVKDSIFTQKFLKSVKPFRVLRFVDWGAANDSSAASWDERSHVDDALWSTNKGVPLEVMIALCNVTDKHGWFSIPVTADDRYVAACAQMLQDNLKPNLSAYVECSSDVWTTDLPQGQTPNPSAAQSYSRRAAHIGDIFHSILGNRAVAVMSSQFTDPGLSDTLLSFDQAHKHVDALSIAPYFGIDPTSYPGGAQAIEAMDVHTHELALDRALKANLDLVTKQIFVAQKYRLPVVGYAGGLKPQGQEHRSSNFNQDSAMDRLYDKYFHNWFSAGAFLFMIRGAEQSSPGHDAIVRYATAQTR